MDSARSFQFTGLGTLALHAGQQPDPPPARGRCPSTRPPATASESRTCGQPVRPEGDGLDLHPADESHHRRLRTADGGPGRRHRRPGVSSGQQAIAVAISTCSIPAAISFRAAALYGGTITLFGQPSSDWASSDLRRCHRTEKHRRRDRPKTRAVYIESLANPKNDVLDYRAIADVAHAHGLPCGLR